MTEYSCEQRLQFIAQRGRRYMTTSASEVKSTHIFGGINLVASVIIEWLSLFVLHQTGLIPTVISLIVCSYLVLFSVIVSGRRLANQMANFNDDLFVLCGQPELFQIKRKHVVRRTIDDIVQELRGD